MRWFHKQRDPISERARLLQGQIAALESQIARLSTELEAQPAQPATAKTEPAAPAEAETKQNLPAAAPAANPEPPAPPPPQAAEPVPAPQTAPQPRLRSTARPHGPTVLSHPGEAAGETTFESVAGNPFKGDEPKRPAPERPELGVRKPGLGALWERLKRQLRGPPASNPRLVSYLAAGSLQGLQPLRYEKRVARNRAIALVLLFALVLWWVIVLFVKR
jgi:hypothetical protein